VADDFQARSRADGAFCPRLTAHGRSPTVGPKNWALGPDRRFSGDAWLVCGLILGAVTGRLRAWRKRVASTACQIRAALPTERQRESRARRRHEGARGAAATHRPAQGATRADWIAKQDPGQELGRGQSRAERIPRARRATRAHQTALRSLARQAEETHRARLESRDPKEPHGHSPAG